MYWVNYRKLAGPDLQGMFDPPIGVGKYQRQYGEDTVLVGVPYGCEYHSWDKGGSASLLFCVCLRLGGMMAVLSILSFAV